MMIKVIHGLLVCLCFQYISNEKQDVLLYERDELQLFESRATFNNRILYDANVDHNKLPADDPCSSLTRIIYTPLSLTGNYYAYEKAVIESGSLECGSPASSAEIFVVDIETERPVEILQLIDETSIVAALKNDNWVKALNIPAEKMSMASTLSKLLAIVNQYSDDGTGHAFTQQRFAVANYDEKKNKIGLRLIRKEYSGFNHYRFLQLGLLVTPNKSFEQFLRTSHGFYLGKFKGGILSAKKTDGK